MVNEIIPCLVSFYALGSNNNDPNFAIKIKPNFITCLIRQDVMQPHARKVWLHSFLISAVDGASGHLCALPV